MNGDLLVSSMLEKKKKDTWCTYISENREKIIPKRGQGLWKQSYWAEKRTLDPENDSGNKKVKKSCIGFIEERGKRYL